jgi:hypothetical protein
MLPASVNQSGSEFWSRTGYQRIRGELMKLGTRVSGTTIRAVLLAMV